LTYRNLVKYIDYNEDQIITQEIIDCDEVSGEGKQADIESAVKRIFEDEIADRRKQRSHGSDPQAKYELDTLAILRKKVLNKIGTDPHKYMKQVADHRELASKTKAGPVHG